MNCIVCQLYLNIKIFFKKAQLASSGLFSRWHLSFHRDFQSLNSKMWELQLLPRAGGANESFWSPWSPALPTPGAQNHFPELCLSSPASFCPDHHFYWPNFKAVRDIPCEKHISHMEQKAENIKTLITAWKNDLRFILKWTFDSIWAWYHLSSSWQWFQCAAVCRMPLSLRKQVPAWMM